MRLFLMTHPVKRRLLLITLLLVHGGGLSILVLQANIQALWLSSLPVVIALLYILDRFSAPSLEGTLQPQSQCDVSAVAEDNRRDNALLQLLRTAWSGLELAGRAQDELAESRYTRVIQFLLTPRVSTSVRSDLDLVLAMDDFAATGGLAGKLLHPVFLFQGPTRLCLDTVLLKQFLIELLLTGATDSSPVLSLSYEKGRLSIRFPRSVHLNPAALPQSSETSSQLIWHDNELLIPASLSSRVVPAEGTGLTALVVTDSDTQSRALIQRLDLLGVSATTDFSSANADFCLTTNDQSPAFHAVGHFILGRLPLIVVSAAAPDEDGYRTSLIAPLHQMELASTIASLQHGRVFTAPRRILVVDDNPGNARLLSMQLGELGQLVQTVSSGEKALQLSAEESFDMVFMDVQMPGMNGIDTAEKLLHQNGQLVILAVTAHATSEERSAWLSSGISDVLIKPVRLERLRQLLLLPPARRQPKRAGSATRLPVFDRDLALANANNRADVAIELFELLVEGLPDDIERLVSSAQDIRSLKRHVHRMHGAIRYSGVPRLASVVARLEAAAKQEDRQQIDRLINLLCSEVDSLLVWRRENPEILAPDQREIRA